jgi:type III secretion protein C
MRQTLKNPFALFCLFSIAWVGTSFRLNFLRAADGPTATEPQRSTYESLTEPRGTPKLRKDRKERKAREEREAKAQERGSDNTTVEVETSSEHPEDPINSGDDEPHYLLPPGQTAPTTPTQPQRSTYDSLTEPRGTPKLRQDRKEQRARDERKPQERGSDNTTVAIETSSEQPEDPVNSGNDEPRYLLPPEQTAPTTPTQPKRSTYDSPTEPQGTPKLRQDRREQGAQDERKPQRDSDSTHVADGARPEQPESPIINFNNVSISEVLKYVSRLTGKNFVYDPQELQFTITMISDSPNSIEEVLAMVLQSLRVHGFNILEEGGAYIINTSSTVRVAGALERKGEGIAGPQIATQVFVLQNLASDQCAAIIKTMVTEGAVVETIGDSSVIVTDVTTNLNRVAQVIKKMDSQVGGLEIGQYVAVNSSPTALVTLAERVLAPLTINKPLTLVPHTASNSVFIVSTPFLIEKTLSIMQAIDLNLAQSGFLNELKFDPEAANRARRLKSEEEAQRNSLKEVEGLNEDEIKQRLMEQGAASVEEIDRMTSTTARELLRKVTRRRMSEAQLPVGTVEATQFLIYRLQYRKSTDMANALKAIAGSLSGGPGTNPLQPQMPVNPELSQSDLLITLNSMQAIEDNNSIVFTGTPASLEKVRGLLRQLDIPVRQVFIEALFLDTTLTNSLQFDVEWAAKIQRSNFGAQVGFLAPTLPAFVNSFNAIQQTSPSQVPPPAAPGGLSAGQLGRKIKFRGQGFRSTGSLIQALQSDDENHIILNPKIVTEHNVAAELFAGQQTPIKGQSIANSTSGSPSAIVATNYNTVETGVTLKVTPLISSGETVTLIIEQKVSSVNQNQVQSQANVNAPPASITETRTVTRIHMPSDHFLVLSGLISEQAEEISARIPCLGSLPIIGNLFGQKARSSGKRNLMIFIRPIIIDTPQDIDEITHRQETNLKEKSRVNEQGWAKEIDDLKAILNIEPSIFN